MDAETPAAASQGNGESGETASLDEAVQLYPTTDAFARDEAVRSTLNASKLTLVFFDLLVVSLAFIGGTWFNSEFNELDPTPAKRYLGLFFLTLPMWPAIFTQQMLYRVRFIGRWIDETSRIIRSLIIGVLGTAAISTLVKVPIGRQWLTATSILLLVFILTERFVARRLFERARAGGSLGRPVLIAGDNDEGRMVRNVITDDPSLGYQFNGFIEQHLNERFGTPATDALSEPKRVVEVLSELGVSSVIIAATAIDVGSSNRLIRTLTEHGIHVEISSTLFDIAANRITVRTVGRVPLMYIEPIRRDGWRARTKRLFDIAVAVSMLIASLPILVPAMIAVKITSPGPALFRQSRVGRDGQLFEMIKVRTMVADAEERISEVEHLNETSGVLFKVKDDPRITNVGKILRKLSIDELPQLINVIRGEMSMVGPRPALPSEAEQWEESLHNRLRVQPGITGMWQVKGRSSDEDHDATYAQLDLYYVDNWNLLGDLEILARTVPVVLSSRGQ